MITKEIVEIYAGIFKVVLTFFEESNCIRERKRIYFAGLKIYERSEVRPRGLADVFKRMIGGVQNG